MSRPPDAAFHAVWLAIAGGTLLLSCLLQIENHTRVVLPWAGIALPETCMTRTWLQVPCPGCGLTRSFISLGHGNLTAAWAYNPAGIYLFSLLALQLPYRCWQLWRIRSGRSELQCGSAGFVAVALIPVFLFAQWFGQLGTLWS